MRFDMICKANTIEHRLTKPNRPWTSSEIKRMNRTIRAATGHDQFRAHRADLMAAYDFACRLETLKGRTPCECICKVGTSEPDRFITNPIHQMPRPNT